MKRPARLLLTLLLLLALLLSACGAPASPAAPQTTSAAVQTTAAAQTTTAARTTAAPQTTAAQAAAETGEGGLPVYSGSPYAVQNGNQPDFTDQERAAVSFELYAPLDELGRCGQAFSCIGRDLMPTEERGAIGQVKPSGWHTVKYDFVDGKYLYNRCHLIGYQLTGENANEENLITGTRYLNVEGMLPFENMVADYIKETENHVLYRVTPVFLGTELVARGVEMEAESVEDGGEGISFHVFCFNVQPGVTIDYATGGSALGETTAAAAESTYILNTGTHKFHLPGCSSVDDIKDSNKQTYTGTRDELISEGYSPCGICHP